MWIRQIIRLMDFRPVVGVPTKHGMKYYLIVLNPPKRLERLRGLFL